MLEMSALMSTCLLEDFFIQDPKSSITFWLFWDFVCAILCNE